MFRFSMGYYCSVSANPPPIYKGGVVVAVSALNFVVGLVGLLGQSPLSWLMW